MKVLYAIQGTGNGHISRAREIIPLIREFCHCDVLISGTQCDVQLGLPVKYRLRGMSFIFGTQGGVDVMKTLTRTNLFHFFREVNQLAVGEYDLVINDFEPVSAWACRQKGIPCISLSHQSALLNDKVPVPDTKDAIGALILKKYAPADTYFGFHFQEYDENIFRPVIRQQIRETAVDNQGHYTVYLPAYDDPLLINVLKQFGDIRWHVFSKHAQKPFQTDNIRVSKITNDAFVEDMAKSAGVLCGAGFETPAEALFMDKKLMVIPMKRQLEQMYNAAALQEMGVPVLTGLGKGSLDQISAWLSSDNRISVHFPDQTKRIVRKLFEVNVQRLLWQNEWRPDLRWQPS
ncbi:MAG: glycosyl transferase [Marinilabiliales bacterium]|nr:glycosyl transferase [Marinilabiliales bacterium]